jgi:hypothetical protein
MRADAAFQRAIGGEVWMVAINHCCVPALPSPAAAALLEGCEAIISRVGDCEGPPSED